MLLFTFSVKVGFAQVNETACKNFKTGIFAYKDSANTIWEIKRTKNLQIETNKQTGLQKKHKIKWLNECEYRLTQQWANKKEDRKYNQQQLTKKIIKTNSDSYEYACACTNGGEEFKGLVVKISN